MSHEVSDKGPPCPTCSSRETSLCGPTDDGLVYLCSPCCEAFHLEERQCGMATVASRMLWVGLAAAALLVLWHVATTPDAPRPVNDGWPVVKSKPAYW